MMHRFATTEEFYVAQDRFRAYIADEVNPARVKAGLSEIRDDEARECFRIIEQFCDDWSGRSAKITEVEHEL
jgi:hypothetical protein